MMETIKVNMTPCEDVQTIHASQNDNEGREWGFELHNNGEKIDSSSISDQLVFKAYEGGTEEILPTNGSTPTTSPFKGDIKYPQGLLSDQEFLYRESPTEEDGLAKITDIKGNTIVWNQLCNHGNFDSNSGWNVGTVSNNELTFTITSDTAWGHLLQRNLSVSAKVGYKYLIAVDFNTSIANRIRVRYPFISTEASVPANTWYRFEKIGNVTTEGYYLSVQSDAINGDIVKYRNFICIDLTAMLGSTKADEIYAMEQAQSGSGVAYFRSLYPLPYYQYDSGSLLPFRGEGIKTVGKNLIDPSLIEYQKNWDGSIITSRAVCYLSLPYGTYTFSIQDMGTLAEVSVSVTAEKYGQRYSLGNLTDSTKSRTVTINADRPYAQFLLRVASGTITQTDFESCHLMIESGSTATDYEPYTSSTLSLPISTYFPNGMKSAGSVYDELTETKAITRTNQINLWEKSWQKHPTLNNTYWSSDIIDSAKNILNGNRWYSYGICNVYPIRYEAFDGTQMMIALYYDNSLSAYRCFITDLNANNISADDFKTRLQTLNAQLVYAIDAPTETEFTTASLVTEDAEIPLSNEDGILIGKCTEQLSSESGFFDAKIKLSDSDGDCYSNKVQLHVERSPQ